MIVYTTMETKMQYKVVIVGAAETGKSSYVNKVLTNTFNDKYEPTLGVDVFVLKFNTTYGPVILNCWDTAGQELYGGLRDGYYIGSDGCIVVFDKNNVRSFVEAKTYVSDVKKIASNIPITIIGNKSDVYKPHRMVKNIDISAFSQRTNACYYDVSVKRNYNTLQPMTGLIRRLTGHNDLDIIQDN